MNHYPKAKKPGNYSGLFGKYCNHCQKLTSHSYCDNCGEFFCVEHSLWIEEKSFIDYTDILLPVHEPCS